MQHRFLNCKVADKNWWWAKTIWRARIDDTDSKAVVNHWTRSRHRKQDQPRSYGGRRLNQPYWLEGPNLKRSSHHLSSFEQTNRAQRHQQTGSVQSRSVSTKRAKWQSLISEDLKRWIAQARSVKMQEPHRWKVNQNGASHYTNSIGCHSASYQHYNSYPQHQRNQYRGNERWNQRS